MASWADGAVDELIAASGGDHTTLASFEGAHGAETPTNGTTCQARVKGVPADTGAVNWAGWQSGQNATTYVVITADSGQETDGVADATGDKASIQDPQIIQETVNTFNLEITNVEFSGVKVQWNNSIGDDLRIAKCMFRDATVFAIQAAASGEAKTLNVGGVIIKDYTAVYNSAILIGDADITAKIVNVTVAGANGTSAVGIEQTAGTVTAKNCAMVTNTTDFSGTITETTTKSEDDGDIVVTDGVDFISPSTDNYTPVASGGLDGTGTTESDSWFTTLVATDMQGTTWAGTPSVGCFEVSARRNIILSLIKKTMAPWLFISFLVYPIINNKKLNRRDFFNLFKWL